MQSGIGLVKGMQSFTSIDTLAPDATYGPVGEIRLIPDPDDVRGPAVCPAQRPDGRQHDRARPLALGARSALVPPADGRPGEQRRARVRRRVRERVLPGVPDRGRLSAGRSEPVLQRDRDGVDRGGHPGHHRGAHRAGTHRRAVAPRARLGPAGAVDPARPRRVRRPTTRSPTGRRSVASPRKHGLVASLAPKPFADQAGSGAHLHWSIWDKDHKTNRLADAKGKDGLSPLARNAIAGVLDPPSRPARHSRPRASTRSGGSSRTTGAPPTRRGASRTARPPSASRAATGTTRRAPTNLELKASDASANPYISLGGVIAAALDGIERGLDPGEPVNEDPGNLTDAERARRRHPALPGDGRARRSTSSSGTRS